MLEGPVARICRAAAASDAGGDRAIGGAGVSRPRGDGSARCCANSAAMPLMRSGCRAGCARRCRPSLGGLAPVESSSSDLDVGLSGSRVGSGCAGSRRLSSGLSVEAARSGRVITAPVPTNGIPGARRADASEDRVAAAATWKAGFWRGGWRVARSVLDATHVHVRQSRGLQAGPFQHVHAARRRAVVQAMASEVAAPRCRSRTQPGSITRHCDQLNTAGDRALNRSALAGALLAQRAGRLPMLGADPLITVFGSA